MVISPRVLAVAGVAIASYAAFAGTLFVAQRKILYPAATDRPPQELAERLGYAEVFTSPENGLRLLHWYKAPKQEDRLVVVVFHGNGGHLGDRVYKYGFLPERGFGLLLTGYRGYGGNSGTPSEAGLIADANSVIAWLEEREIPPSRVVLYGESLGSAVALALAARMKVGGVILEAPPSSVADVAQHHYWYLPARWLLRDPWDSRLRIRQVTSPLLVLHGERDRIVPFKFGKLLFEAATGPKEMMALPEAGHGNVLDSAEARERVLAFIRAL